MTKCFLLLDEIETKRKCYAICDDYDASDFNETVAAACKDADSRGADTLYLSLRDESIPLTADTYVLGGHTFQYNTSFLLLDKALTVKSNDIVPLRLKPLRAGNDALFCAIYNEAFFDVPNSITMNDAEMQRMMHDEHRSAGFFMEGGEPVGTFILQYGDTVPEIAAISIRPDLQNQGYGTRALHTLEVRLLQEGFSEVQLLTAESNIAACALYKAAEYRFLCVLSRWYRTQL